MAAAAQAPDTRPPLTGWLVKQKSDASKSRLLKSSNRRFFTLDFESQTFCYSHNVGNKTVSFPTHFRHILGVEPFATMQAQQAEEIVEELLRPLERSPSNGSFTSVGSMTSFLRKPRLPSFSGFSKRPNEQNGFVVRMRDKTLDLLSESKADADIWIAAIREAVALAKLSVNDNMSEEALKPDPSTSPGSSRASTPGSSSLGSISSPRASPGQEIFEGTFAVAAAIKMFANTPVEGCRPTQMLPLRSASFVTSPRSDTGEGRIEVPLRPPRSARSTASGEKRISPRQFAVTSVVLKQRADDASLTCWGDAAEPTQRHEDQVASRYSDKAQGLSINQRLSQLEFSDDEEPDEADGSRPAMKKVQPESKSGKRQSPASAHNSVIVEACEDFVEPDSDTD